MGAREGPENLRPRTSVILKRASKHPSISEGSLGGWGVWLVGLHGEQLFGAHREPATVLRHLVVVAVRDTRRVELGHQVVHLLRTAN